MEEPLDQEVVQGKGLVAATHIDHHKMITMRPFSPTTTLTRTQDRHKTLTSRTEKLTSLFIPTLGPKIISMKKVIPPRSIRRSIMMVMATTSTTAPMAITSTLSIQSKTLKKIALE